MNKAHVTFFKTQGARFKSEADLTLDELRILILGTSAKSKAKLPWLKLATFGNNRSANDCLRHTANVLSISGVEMDYDSKQLDLNFAVDVLKRSKVKGLVYTSPSHQPDAPKWRVLCPTSANLAPALRETMATRLNGLYGGIFARESFTLSQAYYYGKVQANANHHAIVIEGDFVDLRNDLDSTAMNVPDKKRGRPRREARVKSDEVVDPKLVEAAMAVIPAADDWYTWNRIGMALWTASEGSDDGFLMFDEWSKKSTNYDAVAAQKRWKNYFTTPPTELGMGTLIWEANGAWPPWRSAYDNELEQRHKEANSLRTREYEELMQRLGGGDAANS